MEQKVQDQKLHQEKELLSLADNMAAAAASFSAHGYDAFITAREVFKQAVHDAVSEIKTLY